MVYRCMPFGAVENRGSGPECAFCGMRDPDPNHRLKHNAIACPGATRKPLTLSRRSNLVKHLTQHNIFGEEASTLADKWRYDSGKKAFSCGFCIKFFPTLSDRSSHIDNEHWKNGQDMRGWSLTNVIKGLLLQPELKDLWQNRLASNSWLQESSFRWEPSRAEGLQSKLELGEDSPIELIEVAYELSNYGSELGPQGFVAVTPIPAMLPYQQSASHKQSVTVDQPWNAVSNDTGPFCTDSGEILQWCSSLDAPPMTSTPSNQNLQLNFDLYDQESPNPSNSLLDAHLSGLANGSPSTFSERQRQQYNPWLNSQASPHNRPMPPSSINGSGCNTSITVSSFQRSSEKPLPPLPDCNQASSPFEAGIGSFMDIDS